MKKIYRGCLIVLFLLIIVFLCLLIYSGGFIMINKKYDFAENTLPEKALIQKWKNKGYKFRINHYEEYKNEVAPRNHFLIYFTNKSKPNTDSLPLIISQLHSEMIKAINPIFIYDSLHYQVIKESPNEDYYKDPKTKSSTSIEFFFSKSYLGNNHNNKVESELYKNRMLKKN